MIPIRKARAGSDSFGHVWPEDGSVVEVDDAEAHILLAIPDGGFSIADQPTPQPKPDPDVVEPEPAQSDLSEIDPRADDATDRPTARKTPVRRRTQS